MNARGSHSKRVAVPASANAQRAGRRLAPRIRWALGLVGAALIGLGLYIWFAPGEATVQVTSSQSVVSSGSVTTTSSATTTVLNGRESQLSTAEPAGAPSLRSEGVTIALTTVGVLLVILAAIPTLPDKLGFGTATMEWSPEEFAQATATISAAVNEAGVRDPKVVGEVARAAFAQAASQKTAAPSAEVDWAHAARAALSAVSPGPSE